MTLSVNLLTLQFLDQIGDGRQRSTQIVGAVPVPEAQDSICCADGIDAAEGFGCFLQDVVDTIHGGHTDLLGLRRLWFWNRLRGNRLLRLLSLGGGLVLPWAPV